MNLKQHREINALQLQTLNEQFKKLTVQERIKSLYHYFSLDNVLVTSSFGTQSALLLQYISTIQPQQAIHFLDTGFHFEETLVYKKELENMLGLNVITIHPNKLKHEESLQTEMWKNNASKCCYINKVAPLEQVKLNYSVWISGLMAYQTPFRKQLDIFEVKDNIIKFYPLIDLTEEAFKQFYEQAQLPKHPLETLGYHSIGCLHCTHRGKGRQGRWKGQNKTECGLHFN